MLFDMYLTDEVSLSYKFSSVQSIFVVVDW